MTSYTSTIEWIFIVLWWISLPLYLLFLFILIKYRQTTFAAPFWSLCISQGCADILNLCLWYVVFKLPSWDYYPAFYLTNQHIWGPLSLLSAHYLHFAAHLGVIILSVNRFTAIVLPVKHLKIWTKSVVFVVVSLQWLLPVAAISPAFGIKIGWRLVNASDEHSGIAPYVAAEDSQRFGEYFKRLLVFAVARIPIFLLIYGSMIVAYYRSTRKSLTPTQKSDLLVEFKLALAGLVLVMLDLLYFLSYVYLQIFPTSGGDWRAWNMRFAVIEDVFSWSNPYLLLLFSSLVRQRMKERLPCFTKP